jgi:hypothetical protein
MMEKNSREKNAKECKICRSSRKWKKTSLHSFMQDLFFLGSKTKENTLIISFSWEKHGLLLRI